MVDDDSADDALAFSDLAERLAGPDGRQVAEDAAVRLATLEQDVDRLIREGLPAAEFGRAQDLQRALAVARNVMVLAGSSHA